MPYSADSFSAGESPTTSKWNKLWSNDASFNDGTGIAAMSHSVTAVANPYKFSVYRNAAWTILSSGAKIQFDAEEFDTNNNFDSSTNYRYTCPVTGFYCFSWMVTATITSTGAYSSNLVKNGSTSFKAGNSGVNGGTSSGGSGNSVIVSASAGDTFEINFAGATSGNSGATGINNTYFQGFLISRT